MYECYARVMSAAFGRFVDKTDPRGLQPLKSFFDVVNLYRDVMYTFPSFRHEFFDRRVRPCGFEKLETAFSDVEHRDADALFIDLVETGKPQTYRVFINLHCFRQGFHCNSDMIDFHFHEPYCNVRRK